MRLSARNTLIRAMNDSRFAVYCHIDPARGPAPKSAVHSTISSATELNRRYMAGQADKRMFVNDLYVTIIRRGFVGKVGAAERATTFFRKRLGVDAGEIEREARRELRDTVANFCKEMAAYSAHALGCVNAERGRLHRDRRIPGAAHQRRHCLYEWLLPRMPLDEYLPTSRITFGKKALEFRGVSAGDVRFGAMLSIREYPGL